MRHLQAAIAVAYETDELTLTHMCDVTRIAAPSGHETARGHWLAERFVEAGMDPVADEVGNVAATSPCADPEAPATVIAAHLDTVFPLDTPLEVRREAGRLHAPGISDNGRGIAGMLAAARALQSCGWPLTRPVTFVGTVGEEGAGDLRGIKHFAASQANRIGEFIALDGAGSGRVITGGIGSRRLRFTITGPGGHSWSDFGAPNALHESARLITQLVALPLRAQTTLSVGRAGGGTSINAIPASAWFELDLRAADQSDLIELEQRVRAAAAGTTGLEVTVFGDRPSGRTADDHPLVRAAVDATRAIGEAVDLSSSSTDANVPMSLGIPAVAIGAGGTAGGAHTRDEWYENTRGPAGIERLLRLVLSLAGSAQASPPT